MLITNGENMNKHYTIDTFIPCDRDICLANELNDIDCEQCEVTERRRCLEQPVLVQDYKLVAICPTCGDNIYGNQTQCQHCGQQLLWHTFKL